MIPKFYSSTPIPNFMLKHSTTRAPSISHLSAQGDSDLFLNLVEVKTNYH